MSVSSITTAYGFIFLLGTLFTYLLAVRYIKSLRGENKEKLTDWELLLAGLMLASPVLLIVWAVVPDIRKADQENHYRLLIGSIVLLLIQFTITFLLVYFKYLDFASIYSSSSSSDTSNS